jgi:predicted PurR-regulated permease PerM
MTSDVRARGLVVRGVVALSIAVILIWAAYEVRRVLLMLYVSGLLAIGLSPAVRWLERRRVSKQRRRLPRWAAILILYIGIVAFIVAVFAVLIPPLVAQARALVADLPPHVDRLQQTLVSRGLIEHTWTWSELVKRIPAPGVALGGVLGFLQGVLGAIGAFVTVLVLPYYLLLEAGNLQKAFIQFFPEHRRAQAARVTHNVTVKVGAWLGGQIVLSLVIGSTAALGLWLLGVPYFYVLALLAGIGEAIPVVGPLLAAIPAVLVGFTVSTQTGLFVAAYFGVQQFVENNFLVPRVMQRQVGLSAVAVLIALLIGTELLGIIGALLAVPTAAIVQVLVREHFSREEA